LKVGLLQSDHDNTRSTTYTMTSTPKRGRANTQGKSVIFTPEALAKSLEAFRMDAEAGFGTNPNLNPFSLVLQDGCEEAEDSSAYPDDSQLGTGVKHKEHTFKEEYPLLFINTPPGRCKSSCSILIVDLK
jgi:hypothetical protein